MTLEELQLKIKRASDKMRADDNTKNALKYLEQLTWLLFLKAFEAVEDDRALRAEIAGEDYKQIIPAGISWSTWTKRGLTGEPLIRFVHEELLPTLRDLRGAPQARQIAELFGGVTTVMKSGYSLAEVIAIVDEVDFHAPEQFHTMSVVYETLLAQTADAGWSGEFYTPRPVVELMVEVVNPTIGETVYDPCSGSAGFLVAASEYIKPQARTSEQLNWLRAESVYGQEAGELAALVGTMNLLLHGVDDPKNVRQNTLEQDIRNVSPADQRDVILTNPPFGGSENPQVQQNFPARSAATELLFLQHCLAKLARAGRGGIVLPDGVLYRAEGAFNAVRRRLLTEYRVTGIVRLPTGVFPQAADTRTNLIFFDNAGVTGEIRYYQIHPPRGKRSYSKTNPLTREGLLGALSWIKDGEADDNSWVVDISELDPSGYNLDIPWPGSAEADEGNAPERLSDVANSAEVIGELAKQLVTVAETGFNDALETQRLEGFVVERGGRAGGETPERFVGVSNVGGLAPFKGRPGNDTSRYRRLDLGDFAYNPMRVNVGSIALCRRPDEAGWVSPDYVVFGLAEDAPFSAEFLLTFLKSPLGQAEIDRRSRGAVRRRLYFEDLLQVRMPIPTSGEDWETVLAAMNLLRRQTRELADLAGGALAALERSLFLPTEASQE